MDTNKKTNVHIASSSKALPAAMPAGEMVQPPKEKMGCMVSSTTNFGATAPRIAPRHYATMYTMARVGEIRPTSVEWEIFQLSLILNI